MREREHDPYKLVQCVVLEHSQENGDLYVGLLKTIDCFDTFIILRAMCVVDTCFTVKNLLNAQLIELIF